MTFLRNFLTVGCLCLVVCIGASDWLIYFVDVRKKALLRNCRESLQVL